MTTARTVANNVPAANAGKPAPKQAYPWVLGGIATGMASTCTHPLDLVKVRMQTATVKRGVIGTFSDVFATKGFRGMFDGLSAAWYRGMTYSLVRLRVDLSRKPTLTLAYSEAFAVAKRYLDRNPVIDSHLGKAVAAGAFAGIVGGTVSNPGDIVLIRMQNDFSKPVAERFGYSNVVHGLYRLTIDEGPSQLFRGLSTTLFRAVLTNVGQLTSYDVFKENFLYYNILGDNPVLHFTASFCAGTFATTISQPADVVRSRLMAAHGGNTNPIHISKELLRTGGVSAFFKGWVPAWSRQTPQTVLTFLFLEQLRNLVDRYRALNSAEGDPVAAVLK